VILLSLVNIVKGGTDRFDVAHFYPDSPTDVKWYMTSCQTPNGPFEGCKMWRDFITTRDLVGNGGIVVLWLLLK
jgi:hypothetical protein